MVKDAYSDSHTNFKFSLLFINVAHKYKDTIQLGAKGWEEYRPWHRIIATRQMREVSDALEATATESCH